MILIQMRKVLGTVHMFTIGIDQQMVVRQWPKIVTQVKLTARFLEGEDYAIQLFS